MIVAWLVKRGLSPLLAKLLLYVVLPALVVGFVLWRIDAFGDKRYREGVDATDAAWHEASNRLKEEAEEAGEVAEANALNRLEEHAANVAAEQERIDEAERNGSSVFDVLFGN